MEPAPPTLPELEAKYFVTGVPHSRDTQVIPHLDGEAYWLALDEAISATANSDDVIYITSWFFDTETALNPPAQRSKLINLLYDKAVLGVDVRVIAWTGRFCIGKDHVDTKSFWDQSARFAGQIEARTGYTQIVQNNVDCIRDLRIHNPDNHAQPPLRGRLMMDWGGGFWGSRHQKYIVTYHKATNDLRAFLAGIDFHGSRFAQPLHDPGMGWHDIGVELRGGAASAVWDDFRTRWHEAKTLPPRTFKLKGSSGQTFIDNFNDDATRNSPPVPPSPQVPKSSPQTSVRVLRSYHRFRESPVLGANTPWDSLSPTPIQEVLATYRKAIDNAQRFIYIEDQGINEDEALTEHDTLFGNLAAAANKGTKIILVAPGTADPVDSTNPINFDIGPTLKTALYDKIEPGKKRNVIMYRVHGVCVHSKLVIIDDQFIAIGSANFYDRAMEGLDTELQAAVVAINSLVKDFRVRLWCDHLRVDADNELVRTELLNIEKALSVWRKDWATDGVISFPHVNSALQLVRGLPEAPPPQ